MENSGYVILGIVYLAVIVLMIVAMWKIFQKAGQPGWACIIPIYDTIILLKIVGKPWWWILIMLIPVVNIVFAIWMLNLVSLSFGKNSGFTLGLIFLSFIFWPILGFGDAKYQGPAAADAAQNYPEYTKE